MLSFTADAGTRQVSSRISVRARRREGRVRAFPEGSTRRGTWRRRSATGHLVVETLIAELARTLPLDLSRVFAAAIRAAGSFQRLACPAQDFARTPFCGASRTTRSRQAEGSRAPRQAPVATIALMDGETERSRSTGLQRRYGPYGTIATRANGDDGLRRVPRVSPQSGRQGLASAESEISDMGWDRAAAA